MRRVWLVLTCLLSTCRPAPLTAIELRLRVLPERLDLGSAWTTNTAAGELLFTNDSRATVTAALSLPDSVFTIQPELVLPPGDTTLPVSATSAVAGQSRVTLSVRVAGDEVFAIPLTVQFSDPPLCGEASECATLRFDRATSQCLIEAQPDGRPCGAADKCLRDGRCVSGECVGDAVACDDNDPCTVDVCEAVGGCTTVPRVCPDAPCRVGVCNSDTGQCETAPVIDGVRCGDIAATSCTSVQICVNGACVQRDPPDGFVCAPSTPCQGEGRCQNDVCQRPAASVLSPSWRVGELLEDGGVPPEVWHDVFIGHDGGVVLSSYFASPPMVQAPAGPRLTANARRCLSWNDVIVCADMPGRGVTAVSAANGSPAWTYTTVLRDLPSLALPDWETFLARLVVMGSQRLGVVYESRRAEAGRDTNCRRFSLVVLDDVGRRVVARLIDDPIFLTCNHPHSYGVASDPQGNVFFAFTPSLNVSPALPDPNTAGTVIMAYSPAGVRRWRHFIPNMPGGEIAVGRGYITVEAGRSIYDSARGVVVDEFSIPFGEGLIARDWVAAGPKGVAVELKRPGEDVTVQLRSNAESSRSGLRGAMWWGAPVALRFGVHDGGTALEAFPLDRHLTGTVGPQWTCDVNGGGDPVSFELKPNGVVVMTDPQPGGAGLCENCDPPWAGTRARFFEIAVPGLELPEMPWTGPWGGPGHDHQED